MTGGDGVPEIVPVLNAPAGLTERHTLAAAAYLRKLVRFEHPNACDEAIDQCVVLLAKRVADSIKLA